MKRKIIACLLLCFLLTGCFSYRDINRLLFHTMGVGDVKDGEILFYGEAFKAYRGEGEKAGKETRLVLFGKGRSISEAVQEMRNTVNYPIEYAGSKSLVFSRNMAEQGLENFLDIFGRDQKPSLRVYLFVFDGEAEELLSTTMVDEQFMGLYLYEMMNTQKCALGIISSQYYQFADNLEMGSGINVVPLLTLKSITEESGSAKKKEQEGGQQSGQEDSSGQNAADSRGSGQKTATLDQPYVVVDGAAVFAGSMMKAVLAPKEAEAYKLMTGEVHSGLISVDNPSFPGRLVGFTILKNSVHSKVQKAGDRIQCAYDLKVRVVIIEAGTGLFASERAVLDELTDNLKQEILTRVHTLFEDMREQGIDIFDIQRKAMVMGIKPIAEDYLSNVDFTLNVDVVLDGTGTYADSVF